MSPDAAPLFAPFKLGDLQLPNRIVMAPLTRNRATHGTDAPARAERALLSPARERRTADLRSLANQPAGPGLYLDAGLLQRRAGSGMARGDRQRAPGGRAHIRSALACRPRVAFLVAAGRRAAGRAFGDPRQDQDVHRGGLCRSLRAAGAADRRDRRNRRATMRMPPIAPGAPASTASRFMAPTAI